MSEGKEIEFYAAKVNAWFNTKLEYDKSLLVLSAGAIGLLITLLTTSGVRTITLLFLFGVAIVSFVVCLGSVLAIFLRNAKHLESLIAGKTGNDSLLEILDSISIVSFILGVVLAAIIGMATAANQVFTTEAIMSDKKDTTQHNVPLRESFNGAANVAPQGDERNIRSFNGAQNIAPTPQSGNNSASPNGGDETSQVSSSTGSESSQVSSNPGGGVIPPDN